MGTQQILLIVLSVIIVGAAIAVGIQMFNAQSYSANKTALAADAQIYGTMVIQFYKTPQSLGGSGGDFMRGGLNTILAANRIGSFIGWGIDNGVNLNLDNLIENYNGRFSLAVGSDNIVTITGLGNEIRNGRSPEVITTIKFPEGKISAVLTDVVVE